MRLGVATLGCSLLFLAGPVCGQTPPPAAPPPFRPTLTLSGYLQGEFDAGAVGDSRFPASDRFFVRRARLTAAGSAAPFLTYRVQGEFGGGLGSASGVAASLVDGYIEWTKLPAARVRFGQFKAPYGREWIVSSTQLLTIERSLVSDRLTLNRQIGVEALGDADHGRVGYLAAVLNGNGRNTTVNDNSDYLYVVRGTATPWRVARTGSLEVGANAFWSRDTRLSMPKEFGFDSTPETPAPDNVYTGRHSGAGLDEHFERGIWGMDAEWLRVRFEQEASGAPVVTSRGWYVTPSAFVFERLVQVVGRYEWYRPDIHLAGNETTTWVGGVNYYARGDDAKVMVDYLWVKTAGAADHAKLLARVQVMF